MTYSNYVDLNENNSPMFKGDPNAIKAVKLTEHDVSVLVADISSFKNFTLVQLTESLRDMIDISKGYNSQDGMTTINGILRVNYVYHHTNIIGKYRTNFNYFKRIHVRDLDNPNGEIKRGNVFISNIEYPQLASGNHYNDTLKRFYFDATELISMIREEYKSKYPLEYIDNYISNNFAKHLNMVSSMNLFPTVSYEGTNYVKSNAENGFREGGLFGLTSNISDVPSASMQMPSKSATFMITPSSMAANMQRPPTMQSLSSSMPVMSLPSTMMSSPSPVKRADPFDFINL